MKRFLLTAGFVLLAAASATAQDAKPNFSGTWSLDLAKSDFGPMPAPDSVVTVIEHKEPNLKITTTQKGQQGELTNEYILTTDGKENANKMRTMAGNQEVKVTTRWDGRKLATVFRLDAEGMSIDVNDSYDLSADGKVMTVVRELKTPQGDFSTRMVFNKK